MRKKWTILLVIAAAACQRSGRSPRMTEEEYLLDDQGRLREVRLNDSRSIRFSYDHDDRLVRSMFTQGSVEYGYEPGGNLRWMKDATGVTEYYRDESGQVVDVLWRHGPPHWVHLGHDAWGRILAVAIYRLDPEGAAALGARGQPPSSDSAWRERARAARAAAERLTGSQPVYAIRYDRDGLGRIAAIYTPAGRVSYRWRSGGREVERTLPNGLTTAWTYDEAGRLTRLIHAAATGASIAEYRYMYADTGSLLRVEESAGGVESALEYRRDELGRTCEARPEADITQPCRTDVLNRPEEAGGALLKWDPDGALAQRSADGRTISFEYDDRGLPIRAAAPGLDLGFDWDGDGRLVGSRNQGVRQTYLADPAYATGEPWLEFDATGAVAAARFCDSASFLRVDSAGGSRFVLRDGFHNPRYTFDAGGELVSGTSSALAGRVFKVRDRWTTAPIATGASYAVFDASPEGVLRYLEQANSARRDLLSAPEIVARAFRALVDQRMNSLLRYSPASQVRLVLEPAGVDSLQAARDTRTAFPRREGLFLPSSARPLAPMVFPALLGGTSGLDRPPVERVLDLPALIGLAARAGKPLESIACAAACSGELERNTPALVRYARQGRRLPAIMAQSAYLGGDVLRRLQEAGYRTFEWPAPMMFAGLRPPIRDGRRGLAQAASVGPPPVFPGPAGAAPGLPFTEIRAASVEPLPAAPGAVLALWAEDDLVPGGAQLQDPYAELCDRVDNIESTAPRDLLSQAGTLTGATYDPARNILRLVGDGVPTPSSADSADLAAALQMAYQPQPLYPRFSLDPADASNPAGPWLKPAYYPAALLAGTQFGQSLFQADWLMKQYSFGIAVGADGQVRERHQLPGGLEDLFQISFQRQFEGASEDWTRLWITPGDIKIRKSARSILFDDTPLIVRAKRQVVDPTSPDGLRDDESAVDPATQQFADAFSANYERVAGTSPIFARVREMAKLVETAHWLREIGAPVDAEWAGRMARGAGGPVRVPALSSERGMSEVTGEHQEGDRIVRTISTRTVHLFGGVNLRVEPRVIADEGRLREIEDTAATRTRESQRRVASAPLVRPGERPPSGRPTDGASGRKNAAVTFGQSQGEHRFDASGCLQSSSFADGSVAEYVRKPGRNSLDIRIVRPNGAVLERSGADASLWTVSDPSGRRLFYQYDARGRLSEIRAGDRSLARYQYENNTVAVQAGEYRERFTLDAHGRVITVERSGPGIAGSASGEEPEPAVKPAATPPRRTDPPSLPSDAVWDSSGARTEVFAERHGGFFTAPSTAVRATTVAPDAPLVLDANASRLNAKGGLADAAAARRLEAADAPASVIVQSSPQAARAIEARYGARARVYFGPDAVLARVNAARMPLLDGPADVAIYLPPESAGVEDFRVFDSIRDVLPGMKFVRDIPSIPEAEGAKVLSVAGHDSPELAAYVERLGQAGRLRGKLLLLNTCHGALQPEWNARIIHEFGAVGIQSYTTEISAEALRDVMVRFYDLLGSRELRGEPIERIWKSAVALAAEEAEQEAFRREIQHLLEVVIQISTLVDSRRLGASVAA
jgi:YD repeat-containing protein